MSCINNIIIKAAFVSAVIMLLPCSLSAKDKKDSGAEVVTEIKVITDLQDSYNALTESVPAVCMLPIGATSSVDPGVCSEVDAELNRQFVKASVFKPVTMNKWMNATYAKNKAASPIALLGDISDERYSVPLRYLCKPFLFRCGNFTALTVSFYAIDGNGFPQTYLRLFGGKEEIPAVVSAILAECSVRAKVRDPDKSRKRIMVLPFAMEFRKLVTLPSGEFDFVSTPFIDQLGISLKKGDDYYGQILSYILASTDMFSTVWIPELGDLVDAKQSTSSNVDYYIQGKTQLTDQMNVLYVSLYDAKAGSLVMTVRHPIRNVDLKSIWDAYRDISALLEKKIMPLDSWATVPDIAMPGCGFFRNGYFLGWDSLHSMSFDRGRHIINTGTMLLPMAQIVSSAPAASGKEKNKDKTGKKKDTEPGTVNPSEMGKKYYVRVDSELNVYTDPEGGYVWNLLDK